MSYLPNALNNETISPLLNLNKGSRLVPVFTLTSNFPENKIFNAVPSP